MLSRLVVVVALGCTALPFVTAASASPVAATANTATFQDSTGEAPDAPDITTIVVSNTDAGQISFRINGPGSLTEGTLVDILVDADNNLATGVPEIGLDYAIQLFRGSADLFRWDGTNFTRRSNDPPQTTLTFSNLTIRINAAELGNTTRFGFAAGVTTGITTDSSGELDFSQAKEDFAPDPGHGLWNYTVRIAPLRLLAKSFSLTPRRPQAGRTLTARLVAARSDTGAVLTGGRVVCSASLGGARIAGRGRFIGREARCAWQLPSSARGKRITGSIAVVFEGRRVSRSFAGTVG
jgi:hypothetical protein